MSKCKNCGKKIDPNNVFGDGFCSWKCNKSYSGYFWNKAEDNRELFRFFKRNVEKKFKNIKEENAALEKCRKLKADYPSREIVYSLHSGRRTIFKVKLFIRTIPKKNDEFNLCLDLTYGTTDKKNDFNVFLRQWQEDLEMDFKNEIEGEVKKQILEDLVFKQMEYYLRIAEKRVTVDEGVNISEKGEKWVDWGISLLPPLLILLAEDYIEEYDSAFN